MSAIKCKNCGRMTNTALSSWMTPPYEEADGCYAAFENGKWVKGCWYDKPMYTWMKFVVDTYLKLSEEEK